MNHDDPNTIAHVPEFPRLFGRYELLGRIGKGGMGCVYRARPLAGGPDVALKTPLPELTADAPARERFYREYQALTRFRHPGLAPVLDFGEHEGAYYFAMGFIEGLPLDKLCVTDQFAAARIALAIADAVAHAHDAKIVHRDIKPANVIVCPDGRVVVVDFGVALLTDTDPGDRLTNPGAQVGTRRYMSPEQIRGDIRATGPHSDIYGLGVVLYWMLTGQVPFTTSGAALIDEVQNVPPPVPEKYAPHIDPRLSRAVLCALEKRPEDRFPSMAAFAAALTAVVAPPPAPAGTVRDVRYEFVPNGTTAPADLRGRVYLDVGNDLRPGVLDHHHGGGVAKSATRLVALRPELVRAAAEGGDSATVVLHEYPDLDCAAASYLAAELLTRGELPPGADKLADYLDRVDSGAPMFSLRRPYTLYPAYLVLARRLMNQRPDPGSRWDTLVRGGHRLVEYVLGAAGEGELGAVTAFDCPVLTRADRTEVLDDVQRYERKLAAPATRARRAALSLPTPWGERVTVEALIVRDVQTDGDPDRCSFFKDWARTDEDRCPGTKGFVVLCVWVSRPDPRCIISVRPDSDARLLGLGARLDAAETAARAGTGRERTGPPRPGYDNSDPWYDGRAHGDTIVDSPRSGTALSADEVERIVLEFGGGTAVAL
ncbi:MAG TPA: serine/threonine-protein kinase [Gemmata sp.]